MAEFDIDHEGAGVSDAPVDDGSHRPWHHGNPFDGFRCAIVELRLWLRGVHPLQK